MIKICGKNVAVVVTYNRKKLLLECLEAIQKQEQLLDTIIIIDNNSNDGTNETLKENGYLNNNKFLYKKLEKNTGGAGGFYEGLKLARELNADWVWVMDDDTIPNNNALQEFIQTLNKLKHQKISFLASAVYGINGNCMNFTEVSKRKDEQGFFNWHQYLYDGLVRISKATFVSIFVNGQALKEIGLPCKDYFIWGDDTEYTNRLTKYFGPAYLVGKSKVLHKRQGNGKLDIVEENLENRIKMWYFMVRNNLLNTKEYGKKGALLKLIAHFEITGLKIMLKKNVKLRLKKIVIIQKGIFAYLFGKYDKQAFKNRFNT